MIDPDLIEELPKAQRNQVRVGLRDIIGSGILELQKTRLLEQLASGYEDESDESMVERVRTYRRRLTAILSLEEVSQIISEEEK